MHVLVVEDNEADQRLMKEAFARVSSNTIQVHFVDDGQAVIDFLEKHPGFENAPQPDLLLVDLNLPKKDGREVLAEIRANERFRHIPILILTSSKSETDVKTCYRLGANGYLMKPSRFSELIELAKSIHDFWFTKVIYPSLA